MKQIAMISKKLQRTAAPSNKKQRFQILQKIKLKSVIFDYPQTVYVIIMCYKVEETKT